MLLVAESVGIMFDELLYGNYTKFYDFISFPQRFLMSRTYSFIQSYKVNVIILSIIFTLGISIILVIIITKWIIVNDTNDADTNSDSLKITPYVYKHISPSEIPRIAINFLPDVHELEANDDFGSDVLSLTKVHKRRGPKIDPVNEPEALTAMQMALKMQKHGKFEKAQKLFQHAMALHPIHPDILNHYGEFIEEKDDDVIRADHLYTRALIVCPKHTKAIVNRKRTLPVVDELDEKQLKRIDKKRGRLIKIPHNDASLKRMKKEAYFQHIHHTVAIEGNTMTLAETRMVVETRMAVPGKSILEHNEILGLDAALRFINTTLVNKDSSISVNDILEMHKRVLGHVDPIGAGCFRRTQVFVGEHTPPAARHVPDMMEEFIEWLGSEAVMTLHPVKLAALAHYKFVFIHPFVDGNGRTARLLMNLILMRAGYPPVIIRKQDRSLYYEYLQVANDGDVRPFIRFIAESTEGTLDVYLYATEYGVTSVKALESNDLERTNIIQL